MASQFVLLMVLAVVIVVVTVLAAIIAIKLIGNSTRAGLAALGIMIVGVVFVLLDSFTVIDSTYRDGRDVYIQLVAAGQDKPFCECHSTRSGDKVTTTCNPPGCGH